MWQRRAIGKTALLEYLAGHVHGCRVARASGVQSEMELAFSGIHQLCAPCWMAWRCSAGPPPDRFLFGPAGLLELPQGTEAARLYQESIAHLGQTRLRWRDHPQAQPRRRAGGTDRAAGPVARLARDGLSNPETASA